MSFGEAGFFPHQDSKTLRCRRTAQTSGPVDSSCIANSFGPCTGGEFQESEVAARVSTARTDSRSARLLTRFTVARHAPTVQTDANNCGTCGNSCNGGSCVRWWCDDCSTAAGLTLCGTTCVNLQTDASNCGSCGHQCIQGVGCVDGLCQCPQGQSWTNVQSSCSGAVRQGRWPPCTGPKGTSASIDMCYCTLGPSGTPMANQTPYECTQAHVLGIAGSVTGLWTFTDPTCCTSGLSFCNGNCTDLQYDAQKTADNADTCA